MSTSNMGRRFRARATSAHFAILPTEIPIPAEQRNVIPEIGGADVAWYVCTTAPQCERRAADSLRRDAELLRRRGLKPLLPYVPCLTRWQDRKRGSLVLPRREVQTPRLRSYLFVGAEGGMKPGHLNLMAERDQERRNRHGLIAVLGLTRPDPDGADKTCALRLSENDCNTFLARLAQEEREAAEVRIVGDCVFAEGDAIRVTDGPFASYDAVVSGIDAEHGRLLAEISIFGRATPIELDFSAVEIAA